MPGNPTSPTAPPRQEGRRTVERNTQGGSVSFRRTDQPLLRFHLSRAFTRNTPALVCTLVLLGLLLQSTSCTRPQLIENNELNQARIYDVIERASTASRLQVIHPLSIQLISRSEVAGILGESSTLAAGSKDWSNWKAAHSAMGLSSEATSTTAERIGLLSRIVTGIYVPEKKTLYIVGQHALSARGGLYLNSLGTIGNEVTLAHEVIHALQHQHYPKLFDTNEALWPQQTDATLALHAAIEGDATLWAAQSLGFLGRARDPEDVLSSAQDEMNSVSDAEPLLREQTVFPYTYGYRFAYLEGRTGLEVPPASTEQILHPESGRRRDFQAINLSNYVHSIETDGCRVLHQDTMGEFTISLWLRRFDPTIPQHVWDGWDGDRWLVADCRSGREVLWLTSWDTEKDASEFETTLREIASKLPSRTNLQAPAIERQSRDVIVSSNGLRPTITELKRTAIRARVTTRAELVAHFPE